jgi:Right handed beta helix region
MALATPVAAADGVGVVDTASGEWRLRGPAGDTTYFYYGSPGDIPFVGDWNCNGTETPGLYRQSDGFVYLRNSNSQGVADIRFFFGSPGDIPLAGDFDGDGCDTVSIYRPTEGRAFIINELGANQGGLGAADFAYYFGDPGDKPFVGDFDNDGIDELGLHRESTGLVYFRLTHTQGVADSSFIFGDPGDRIVAGTWTGAGADTVGLLRQSNCTIYLRNSNSQGVADATFVYGMPSGLPVAGEFGPLSGGSASPNGCDGAPRPLGAWPTPGTTGFRGAGLSQGSLTPSGSITTSSDGQVIDRVDVTGGITIRHDNVTIRNSRINYTGNYGILVEKVNGVCPTGTVIRYVEIDGSLAADDHAPAYDAGCGYTFDRVHLHDSGRAIHLYGSSVVTNSYLVNETYGPSGAHREPLLVYGSDKVIRNNVLICDVPQGGCSAALAIYGSVYPPRNILVEGNWLASTSHYCAYGGETHTYANQAANVDFFDNAFSTSLNPQHGPDCGWSGNIIHHRNGVDGNQRAGNYIYETGRPID